jgi:hypothetical protein
MAAILPRPRPARRIAGAVAIIRANSFPEDTAMTRQACAMIRTTLAVALVGFGLAAEAKKEYCAFLAAEDFTAAGVAGVGRPSTNTDEAGAFCVYAGKSSATGGVEFDFFVAGTARESEEIWANVRPESNKRSSVATSLPGVDKAEIAKITGKVNYTSLGVKRGKVVFHVGVPTTPKSEEAVLALARLVLQRTEKLGR